MSTTHGHSAWSHKIHKKPICIYQPVQGVVDLMDAGQCSQVGIQLKIYFQHKYRYRKRVKNSNYSMTHIPARSHLEACYKNTDRGDIIIPA